MEQIYSEEDLVQNNGLPWGQWEFSLSNEEINGKLAVLPKAIEKDKDSQHWVDLFSLLQKEIPDFNPTDKVPDSLEVSCTPMECSEIVESEENEFVENDEAGENSNEELTMCLVDVCNQVAPKLRFGLGGVQDEMESLNEEISKLRGNTLMTVMTNVWSQLNSDPTKFSFCIPFTSNNLMCKALCEHILLPWLSKYFPTKIEQLSAILSKDGETVCVRLVAPLLRIEDSPLVQDTMNLEELMTSMSEKHWTVLLKELLSDMRDLIKWQIPLLATVLEHAQPSSDELHLIVNIISSSGMVFAQNRDFGALLVAVAKRMGENSGSLAPQLKLIVNNYKGPLKFKITKLLEEVED